MKKYVLAFLFFLGCFFVSFSLDSDVVEAAVTATVTTDAYDSRKVKITLEGIHGRTNRILVQEVVTCQEGTEGCITRSIASVTHNVKILSTTEFLTEKGNITASLDYVIKSDSDGEKMFLVDTYEDANILTANSCIFTHVLSTLPQRIVVNPDGSGEASHVYDNIQYSSVRKTNIKITLLESEKSVYTGWAYICEYFEEQNYKCGDYQINDSIIEYYIETYGDGQKQINIFLEKTDNKINGGETLVSELVEKAQLISKKIYLDTIGPEITIEGGNWVFVEAGKTYTAQNATCIDAVFPGETCTVTNDANVVDIDYTNGNYQIVTYEATDKLGNVSTTTVKIKVEIKEEENNLMIYLIVAGGVLLLTGVILGYVLIKNNEKKKKMSYI